MAQIVVRNLDDGIVERLKQRAVRSNRSLEAEVRQILEHASEQVSWDEAWGRIEAFRERLCESDRSFTDSADIVRSMRSGE